MKFQIDQDKRVNLNAICATSAPERRKKMGREENNNVERKKVKSSRGGKRKRKMRGKEKKINKLVKII